jgi:hypothetical protein
VLPREQNKDLFTWQCQHLRVTWRAAPSRGAKAPKPQSSLISGQLNSATSTGHPFHQTLKDARAHFRAIALDCG